MSTWGIFEGYGFDAFEIVGRTEKTVTAVKYGNQRRVNTDKLRLEVADEKTARDLVSRLEQSRQQMHAAERQAREEHFERVARLLGEARQACLQKAAEPQ